jgi:hypothetical protein
LVDLQIAAIDLVGNPFSVVEWCVCLTRHLLHRGLDATCAAEVEAGGCGAYS